MMRQYLAIKAAHPDAIVFYRMGDFYEMFLRDAEIAAPLLDIALTTRDKNKPDAVPMCGVPVHAADQYLALLAAARSPRGDLRAGRGRARGLGPTARPPRGRRGGDAGALERSRRARRGRPSSRSRRSGRARRRGRARGARRVDGRPARDRGRAARGRRTAERARSRSCGAWRRARW
jgi:hypothetical protein